MKHPLFSRHPALWNRLKAGATVGLIVGTFAALAGLGLSDLKSLDPETYRSLAGMVVLFAIGGAAIGACVFDFHFIYIRLILDAEDRRKGRVPSSERLESTLWDGEVDLSSRKKEQVPENPRRNGIARKASKPENPDETLG